MPELLPLFLDLAGRDVLLVGGGVVAAAKLRQLLAAGAAVQVIAPEISEEIRSAGVRVTARGFAAADLDGVWLVVAAATPPVNRAVAAAAHNRRIFVNAVDDPQNASAFMGGVVRRGGVTLAVSTAGRAPALTSLVREALDRLIPPEIEAWVRLAERVRDDWRRTGVPVTSRKRLLLDALHGLYDERARTPGEG